MTVVWYIPCSVWLSRMETNKRLTCCYQIVAKIWSTWSTNSFFLKCHSSLGRFDSGDKKLQLPIFCDSVGKVKEESIRTGLRLAKLLSAIVASFLRSLLHYPNSFEWNSTFEWSWKILVAFVSCRIGVNYFPFASKNTLWKSTSFSHAYRNFLLTKAKC